MATCHRLWSCCTSLMLTKRLSAESIVIEHRDTKGIVARKWIPTLHYIKSFLLINSSDYTTYGLRKASRLESYPISAALSISDNGSRVPRQPSDRQKIHPHHTSRSRQNLLHLSPGVLNPSLRNRCHRASRPSPLLPHRGKRMHRDLADTRARGMEFLPSLSHGVLSCSTTAILGT